VNVGFVLVLIIVLVIRDIRENEKEYEYENDLARPAVAPYLSFFASLRMT
jgi:hypothetical protein